MPTTTINLTGQALSKVDDTNVTLTLGGTPATSLLKATSLTLGWSGQLSVARGGTGLSALGTASQLIRVNGAGTALEYFTPTYGSGTVTTVSVVSANGFAGTVANAGTTPAITLSTTITGLLKGNGTAISAASAGTDYEVPLTFSTGLTRTVNTITIDSTVVTLTGAQALSNKTGLISQWTNDAGYLTSLSGAVTSVSGTTNRITSTGGSTPVIDISASYVGQTSITTLGTIGTGTWQGTIIGKSYGGTGVNIGTTALTLGTASSAAGSIILQNATNANTVTINSGVVSASYSLTLPTAQGGANTYLKNDGAGTLSWAAAGGVAGSDTQVQFNDGGVQAGDADFTWNKTTNILNSTGGYNVNGTKTIRRSAIETIIFGDGAGGGNYNTIVGDEATYFANSGTKNCIFGQSALSSSGTVSYSIFMGAESTGAANTNTQIAIGYLATATAANQGVLGSNNANGYISNWYFNGVTHTAAYATILNACGGSGTNNAGASLTFSGGKSTGSAAGGSLVFKTSTTLGSGTTLQSLVSRLTISGGAVTTDASTATWADALDFVFGTTTGTKFGTTTTQKLAFWNATPIVQPTTAVGSATLTSPGAGTNIKSDDTFDGYTLQQVVKALRNLGILA